MWYEKDFTIPLFCKKVRFEYDDETGEYAGKFLITKKQADKIKKKLKPGKKPGKHTERISSRTEKDRGRERTGSVPADT